MYINQQTKSQPYFGLKLDERAVRKLSNDTLEFIKNSPLTREIDKYYPNAKLYIDETDRFMDHSSCRKNGSYIDLGIAQLDYIRCLHTPKNDKIAMPLPEGNAESYWNDIEIKIREIFSSTKPLDDLQAERGRIAEYNDKHQELVRSIISGHPNETRNTAAKSNTGICASIGEFFIKLGNWLKK